MRIAEFADGRSLWMDEAKIAVSVLDLGWSDLLGPLKFEQGAPWGFMALSKASSLVLGDGERALRLPSLLAGLSAVVAFASLVRRNVCSMLASVIAMGLFSFSPWLVYYSNELKPYAFDVLFVVLFAWIATTGPTMLGGRRRPLLAGLLGVVAPWFSVTAAFAMGAIAVMAWAEAGFDRTRAASWWLLRRRMKSVLPAWALSSLLVAVLNYRHFVGKRHEDFWQQCLLSASLHEGGAREGLRWFVDTLPNRCLEEILMADAVAIPILAAVVGLAVSKSRWAAYGALVASLAFAANAAGLYAIVHRLSLFVLPVVFGGCGLLIDWCNARSRVLAALIAVTLVWGHRTQLQKRLAGDGFALRPAPRSVLESIAPHIGEKDQLWVQWHSQPTVYYYRTRMPWLKDMRARTNFHYELGPIHERPQPGVTWIVDLYPIQERIRSDQERETLLERAGARNTMRLRVGGGYASRWELDAASGWAPETGGRPP